jgi:hypothetical protein
MGRGPDDDASLVAMIDGGQSIRLGRLARSRPVHAAIAALLACAAAASPAAGATPPLGGHLGNTLPDPSEVVDTVTNTVGEPVQQVVEPLPDAVKDTVDTVIEPVPDPVKQPLKEVIDHAPVAETVKDPVKTVTDRVTPPRDPRPAQDARPSPAGAAPATAGQRRTPGPGSPRRRQAARARPPRASAERPGRRSRTRETRRARGAASPADAPRAPQPVGRPSTAEAQPVSASPAGGGALELVRPVLERTAFPLFLLGLVAAFLAIQGRIDRRDPKLALARVEGDADLAFPEPGTVG